MAGLVRRELALGQFRPLRSRPQNPQHALQHLPSVAPRTTAPLTWRLRLDQRLQQLPLHIGQFHTHRCACKFNSAQLLSAVRIYEIGSSNSSHRRRLLFSKPTHLTQTSILQKAPMATSNLEPNVADYNFFRETSCKVMLLSKGVASS
jgi:hypothetical protein